MGDFTLYHYPQCSKSRAAFEFLTSKGVDFAVVDYMKNPPSRATLQALADKMGGVRGLLRANADVYAELGLADAKWTDAQLLDFMGQHPVLLERPLLDSAKGARIGRPGPEVLADLLV
jgi:arsenate reductase